MRRCDRAPPTAWLSLCPAPTLSAVRRRFSHERVVAGPASGPARAPHFRVAASASSLRSTRTSRRGTQTRSRQASRLSSRAASGAARPSLPFLLRAAGSRELPTPRRVAPGARLARDDPVPRQWPDLGKPGASAYAGATLFRVNWTWRERGMMARPDAVFTADPDLPPRRSRAILVFPRAGIARRVLLQHLLALRPAKAGYLMLDRLRPPLADLSAATIPTNGALMVARRRCTAAETAGDRRPRPLSPP